MTDYHTAIVGRLLPLLDLTSLNDGFDDDIAELCKRAVTPAGKVAAVCVWPQFVADCRRRLAGSGIRVATVVNFPHGGADSELAVTEARAVVADGADEVDLVMPYEAWLAGERDAAKKLVAAVKDAIGARVLLKVILETGALGSAENAAAISRDAIGAGADFLKTSTGKRQPGATLEAAEVLLNVIREQGGQVGFKAAGGVRTTVEAAEYLELADQMMGRDWAGPQTFRIGASSLLDDLLSTLYEAELHDPESDY